MRLIDADKLIGDIQKKLAIKDIEYLTEQEMSIVKMIINAPTENEWIPVSERLPETSVYVLATTEDGEVMNAIIREDFGKEKYWFHRRQELPKGYIVAWMPLPEPYKVGDKE